MKIKYQADPQIRKFQISQKLRFMYRQDFLDTLEFYDNFFISNNIDSIATIEFYSFVL